MKSFFLPGGLCACLNLQGKTASRDSFDCEHLNEANLHQTLGHLVIVEAWFYAAKIRSLYLYRSFELGVEVIAKAEVVAAGVPGQVKVPEAYFYSCLMLASSQHLIDNEEARAGCWRLFSKYENDLKMWADHCPENYYHKYCLVMAERARVDADGTDEVLAWYDKSIESAKASNYPNNVALAYELKGRFALGQNQRQYALNDLKAAHAGYQVWGAAGKFAMLEEEFPELAHQELEAHSITLAHLDLLSVHKAAEAISSKLEVRELIQTMLTIVVEGAGADRGVLLLNKGRGWRIEACAILGDDGVQVGFSTILDDDPATTEGPGVPLSVVNYVLLAQESVAVSEPARDPRFAQDPYVTSVMPRSVLCIPVVSQGRTTGIIYLENKLGLDVFSTDRRELIAVLAGQIAISLANATLYAELKCHAAELRIRNDEITLVSQQRKLAEESVLKNELQYKTLAAAVPGFLFSNRGDGWSEFTSRKFYEYTGLPDGAANGQGWIEAVHPDDREGAAAHFFSCLRERRTFEREYRFRSSDGSYRWFLARSVPLLDEQGMVVKWYGIATDIDDQKQAEEHLRESERRLRQLADAMPQIVWASQPDGILDYYNRQWYELTGAEEGSTGDQSWLPILHPEDRQKCLDVWYASIQTGQPYEIEYRFKFPETNEYRWHLGRALPVRDDQGRIVRWFGTCTDIDDQKQAEYELRELNTTLEQRVEERTVELQRSSEAAGAASQAKSEFLANMSHEIRTPMNGILGMTGLALETDLSVEQREYLDGVKLSAEALLVIINDILDFSKIEAGKFELNAADFDLRESLGNLMRTFAQAAHAKGLELLCDIRPETADALVGDSARLRQILINLVGNAVKFTKQGEIAISVETEAMAEDVVWLHFTVSDTGIGIPLDKQESIFAAFTQADGTTTRDYGGTGLGLTISSRLVELMGGRVWVESEVGQGSKFHFTARFGLRTVAATYGSTVPMELRDIPVLVVDDNATNRRILNDILTNWGMKPTLVDGGKSALEALRISAGARRPFALLLLDITMPGMDGFSVIERIGLLPGSSLLPIIALSSTAQSGDRARCRELGVAAYLVKPVDPSELLSHMKTALSITMTREVQPQAAPAVAAESEGRSLRVLLAEDNAVNRMLVVRILQKAGHVVEIAINGMDALAALERQTFDLVLMDVQMPVMGGFEATTRIREQEKVTGHHIPIVAMTAHAMKGDRERCLEAGMDGYLSKPVSLDALRQTVSEISFQSGADTFATVTQDN